MIDEARSRVTAVLATLGERANEERVSAGELMPLVYDELRRIARGLLGRERKDHTLQPTALVHEAYLKMVDQSRVDWRGRTHFRAVGAQAMRRILIDHARRHGSAKRGGTRMRVTLGDAMAPDGDDTLELDELLTLNEALERLRELDGRQARVVELRFFGGLTTEEVAETLGVSPRTVEGDWTHARAWLRRSLAHEQQG